MNGQRITADRFVVATGGHAVRLDLPGMERAILSDDAFSLPALPKKIAIIGSGYIGVEFASIFRSLGAEVDLVYRQPLPLRGFDQDLRTAEAAALSALGVKLHPETTPLRVDEIAGGQKQALVLSNGTTVETDLVFCACGRAPNVRPLLPCCLLRLRS